MPIPLNLPIVIENVAKFFLIDYDKHANKCFNIWALNVRIMRDLDNKLSSYQNIPFDASISGCPVLL